MLKKILLATLLVALSGTAAAKVETIDLTATQGIIAPATATAPVRENAVQVIAPPEYMISSTLPEPEVFIMMLIGLLLIGVRAGSMNHEKFEQ